MGVRSVSNKTDLFGLGHIILTLMEKINNKYKTLERIGYQCRSAKAEDRQSLGRFIEPIRNTLDGYSERDVSDSREVYLPSADGTLGREETAVSNKANGTERRG